MAIAVTIISSYVILLKSIWLLIGAIFIIIILVLLVFYNYNRYKNITTTIKLAFAYNVNTNDFVAIKRYEFSEITKLIYDCYCNEIGKDKKTFVLDPLHKILDDKTKDHPSIKVIQELTGYYLLKRLSRVVNSYYKMIYSDSEYKKMITEFSRVNLTEFIEYNRFFDVLTKNYQRRDIKTPESIQGELAGLYSEGKLYELINFDFPKGTTVKINKSGEIEIKSPLLSIVISVAFKGLNFNDSNNDYFFRLPFEYFIQYYLGVNDALSIKLFSVKVRINTKVSLLSMMNPNLKKKYNWVNTFIWTLNNFASFNKFLSNINWSTIETNVLCNTKHTDKGSNDYIITNDKDFLFDLINFTMQLLIDKKYKLIVDLADYLGDLKIDRCVDPYMYKIFLVNLAQAHKNLNNIEAVVNIVDKIENDGDPLIELMKNILLGKNNKALEMLEKNDEIFNKITNKDIIWWPIFGFLPKDRIKDIISKRFKA